MHITKNTFKKSCLALCIILPIILLLLGGILFWQYLPYQNFLSKQIINILESNNIKVSALNIESASSSEIVFSNIKLDGNPGLSLEHLKLEYDISKLVSGKLNSVEAENADVNLYKKDRKFLVSGLEGFLSSGSKNNNKIPTDQAALENIAPTKISIRNLNILAKDADFELFLPLNFTFNLNPQAAFNVDSTGIDLKIKPYQLTTGNIKFNAALNNKKWQGEVVAPSVKITGLQADLPSFLTKIDFVLDSENLSAKINLNDDKNLIITNMELFLPVAKPTLGNLNIKQIQFPWGGGLISSQSINVALDMKSPILFNINLKNVDLSDTLEKISKGKIKGTGKISGMFPIIYKPDGTIILKDGMAEEINDGIISVSPELLPGNNAQLELARSLLQNFHYTRLKIIVSSKGDKSAINLELEGKNPDSSKRPIKFNINLTGDIMPLIQQSIIPFNDIKELLKQEKQ